MESPLNLAKNGPKKRFKKHYDKYVVVQHINDLAFDNGTYTGYADGKVPHGNGRVTYANGRTEEGPFREGKRHGTFTIIIEKKGKNENKPPSCTTTARKFP